MVGLFGYCIHGEGIWSWLLDYIVLFVRIRLVELEQSSVLATTGSCWGTGREFG